MDLQKGYLTVQGHTTEPEIESSVAQLHIFLLVHVTREKETVRVKATLHHTGQEQKEK